MGVVNLWARRGFTTILRALALQTRRTRMTEHVTAREVAQQINNTLTLNEMEIASLEDGFASHHFARVVGLHCLKFTAEDFAQNPDRVLPQATMACLIEAIAETAACYQATAEMLQHAITRLTTHQPRSA